MVIDNGVPSEQELIERELAGGEELPGTEPEEKQLTPEQEKEEKDFREFAGLDEGEKIPSKSWEKRWRTMYHKAKDSERKASEAEEDKRLMREHMAKIMASTEKVTESVAKIAENKEAEKESAFVAEIQSIEDVIKELKSRRTEARTDGSWDIVDSLEDKIDDQKEALRVKKETYAKYLEHKEKAPARTGAIPDITEEQKEVNKWAEETDWYNPKSKFSKTYPVKAAAMRQVAYDLDISFKSDDEWKGKKAIDRIKHIQNEVEKEFSYKDLIKRNGNGNDDAFNLEAPGQNHSGSRGDNGNDRTLTADEKRVAHAFYDDIVGVAKAEAEYLKWK